MAQHQRRKSQHHGWHRQSPCKYLLQPAKPLRPRRRRSRPIKDGGRSNPRCKNSGANPSQCEHLNNNSSNQATLEVRHRARTTERNRVDSNRVMAETAAADDGVAPKAAGLLVATTGSKVASAPVGSSIAISNAMVPVRVAISFGMRARRSSSRSGMRRLP